jgi:O-antigen/teichoic acid export membrane protein
MTSGDQDSIKQAALSGVRWTALSRLGAEATAFVSSIVLARLIAPSQFGAAVLALFLCTLASVLREQALSAPLVQRAEVDDRHFEIIALASLVLGFAFAGLTLLLVPLLWRPAFGAVSAHLATYAAAAFPIAAWAAVGQAWLQRRLRFKVLASAEISGLVAGAAASILLAALGANGVAIVAGSLVSLTVSAVIVTRAAIVARPRWHPAVLPDLTRVGLPGTVSATTYTVFQSIDYFLIGALRNVLDVGLYWRGYQLAVEYQSKITGIMLRVAFPVYSRLEHDSMRAMRARIVRVHATALFPLLSLLLILAPVAIPLLYGERWSPAVPLTQILCLAGFGLVVGTGLGPLLTALGETRALMLHTLAWLAVLVLVVVGTAHYSITAVAIGVAIVQFLTALSGNYFLGSRIAKVPMRDVVADLVPAVAASAALVACALPLASALRALAMPSVLVVVLTSLTGLGVYLLVIRLAFRTTWNDVLLLMRTVLGRSPRQAGLTSR